MEYFAKIVKHFYKLTIFAKLFILDVDKVLNTLLQFVKRKNRFCFTAQVFYQIFNKFYQLKNREAESVRKN